MGGDARLLPGGDDSERWSVLRDPRHRRILSVLLDRSHPMTDRDLSVQIAALEADTTPSNVPESELRSVRVDLYHRCLPKLEAEGWIERRSDGIVAAEPLSEGNASLLDSQDLDDPSWKTVAAVLARPRRREVVSVLADTDRHYSLSLEELAAELRERGWRPRATKRRKGEPGLLGTLHHVDLPKLADVGLIEYDPDERILVRNRFPDVLVRQLDLDDR